MTNFEKYQIYIISLWLLFLLIIVIYFEVPICFFDNCKFIGFEKLLTPKILISSISFIFLFLGVLFYFSFKRKLQEAKNLPTTIDYIENINYEHLTFLTTYIIPLISFNLEIPRNIIALVILLSAIGVIYIKTDKFYANPTLAILGFKIYKIKVKDRLNIERNLTLIIKGEVFKGDSVRIQSFESNIVYGVKSNAK